ncbi:hypothetical protein CDL15_Pgr020345 [Punica granatum]|uniref:Uncharacterized protein n=1 Tax=Punica granatum TaxID=22663 RepID=A0A218VVX8_PUNGR|nr:hypothetical protein CDL15_Pgr020345 [Punica granatum]
MSDSLSSSSPLHLLHTFLSFYARVAVPPSGAAAPRPPGTRLLPLSLAMRPWSSTISIFRDNSVGLDRFEILDVRSLGLSKDSGASRDLAHSHKLQVACLSCRH